MHRTPPASGRLTWSPAPNGLQARRGQGPRHGPHGGQEQVRTVGMGDSLGPPGALPALAFGLDLSRFEPAPAARAHRSPWSDEQRRQRSVRMALSGPGSVDGARRSAPAASGAAAAAPCLRPAGCNAHRARRTPHRRTHVAVRAAKELHFNKNMEALKKMQAGADKLATVVGVTLGPKVTGRTCPCCRRAANASRGADRGGSRSHKRSARAAAAAAFGAPRGSRRAPAPSSLTTPTRPLRRSRRCACPRSHPLPPRAATWCWSPSMAPPRS
jgi:hypothetical protein